MLSESWTFENFLNKNKIEDWKFILFRLFEVANIWDESELAYPILALRSFYKVDTLEIELVWKLLGNRTWYKKNKMFGKKSLFNWSTACNNSINIDDKSDVVLNQTLKIIASIKHLFKIKNITVCAVEILQNLYPLLKEDQKGEWLEMYFGCIDTLYGQFKTLNSCQKSFFYRQLHTVHKISFLSRENIQISNKYSNIFGLKEQEVSILNANDDSGLSTESGINLEKILTGFSLLKDSRLCLEVYKIIYPYIEMIENDDWNIIQKLKNHNLIVWDQDMDFPEHPNRDKRVNYVKSREDVRYDIYEDYCKNHEIREKVPRKAILMIIEFLNQLVDLLILKDITALTLAVNLLPEWRKRLKNKLKEVVETQTNDGNLNYLYVNFVICSYRYFKSCREKLEDDDLFNSLFMLMKK